MVGIPEHCVASICSLPSVPELPYHDYDYDVNNNNSNGNDKNKDDAIKSTSAAATAALNDDNETANTGEATDGGGLDGSASLSHLSSVTYQRRSIGGSIVEGEDNDDDDDDDDDSNNNKRRIKINRRRESLTWQLPGDSPLLRAVIVIGTYLVAMLVPNVQSLVAVVGAVTGSSTALLIPPILQLAWIRHMETLHEKRLRKPPHLGEWEGGPSKALKRTLFESVYEHRLNHPKRERRNSHNKTHRRKKNKYLFDKILSWFLLTLGSIFALIGSYFSVRDIIQSYDD